MAFVDWVTQFGVTTSSSDVTLTTGMEIEIASNVTCRALTVDEGATLRFAPAESAELSLWANFELHGVLEMKPASFSVFHTVTFEGINVENFVGGGQAVLSTDIGLWVREHGYLDINGPYRKAWTRLAGSEAAGQTVLTMAAAPSGWQVGDKIVICPTDPITTALWYSRFEERTITAVSGNDVTVSAGLTYAHNSVDIGDGLVMTAEVLNITRNALIRGRPGAEAHIHLHVHDNNDNSIRQLQLDAMGPRKAATPSNAEGGILGRYPIHFHHGFDGTRGTFLESCVSTRSRNRGFVTHLSHGITLSGCVAYDAFDSPFWWDGGDDSNDIFWDRCVAALVKVQPAYRGFRLTGFDLQGGTGNKCIGCVAVGVQGNASSSGFNWPESAGFNRLWIFEDCCAHNIKIDGIFTWQNDNSHHIVDRFVAYHCGKAGIEHGAYLNIFDYRNAILYGCTQGVQLHSHSAPVGNQLFTRLHVRGGGVMQYAFNLVPHTLPAPDSYKTLVDGCTFEGYSVACFGPGGYDPAIPRGTREWLSVTNCTLSGPGEDFLFGSIQPDSLIKVDNGGQAFDLREYTQSGTLNTTWNARVTNISSFAASPPAAFDPHVLMTLPDTSPGSPTPPDPDTPDPLVLTVTTVPTIGDAPTGWRTSPVLITATATAGAVIEYLVDPGVSYTTYTAPFTVSAEGAHHYTFRATLATDEVINPFGFQIDLTDPVSMILARRPVVGNRTVTITAVDPLPDGVDIRSDVGSILYQIDGGPVTLYEAPFKVPSDASHTIAYYSVDVAGNREASRSLVLPPAAANPDRFLVLRL